MDIIILVTTCLSIFVIFYHHAGYPVLLKFIIMHKKSRSVSTLEPNNYRSFNISSIENKDEYFMSITIILPAYNEQKYIEEKLHNLASMDYPSDKIKIIVACDGCTDQTAKVAWLTANALPNTHIEILEFTKNRGKCALLNDVTSRVSTELIAFSDISSLVSLDAINICNLRFKDPKIGGINGNYRLLHPTNAGEAHYWKYQKNIKMGEESLGSILGAHGAFYTIRTKLFSKLPENTINDDFVIPMRVIEQGYQVLYDPRINAIELESSTNNDNWKRRKRIGFGNTQQLAILKNLLKPKYRGIAFAFISGKALRVLMPFFMIYTLISSLYCAMVWPIFIPVLAGQISIYVLALIVAFFHRRDLGRIPNSIHYIVTGHIANMLGSLNYLIRSKTHW